MSTPTTQAAGLQEDARQRFFARDELEALFDVGSDAEMENEEEEDEGTSSSTRVDTSVGSRRPREDDSDASSSKRSHSGSDRPLADAGPLSSPRSGGDSTSSSTVVSRTGPVRDHWSSARPLVQCATTGCRLQARSNIASAVLLRRVSKHCTRAVASQMMMSLRSSTLIRRRIKCAFTTMDSFVSSDGAGIRKLPVEAECRNGRHAVKAGVPLLKTSTRTQLLARERYERFSKRSKIERLHRGAVEAGIL
ncbi:unnamed protein product [Phytophthora fragariaefolia]|uniref:Unnamed protein product n=1 Tax=Phytophthora fragariaefolia TaxID=1490495 RepID=A0A9W6WVN1_9STRA|nr:unnamed protein product [Phytophthora fragariaefolia]